MTKSQNKHEMTVPNWLLKLKAEGMSNTEIGEAIGKSSGYASLAINSNSISKTAEVACEFIWHKKFGLKTKTEKLKVCLVTINAEHTGTIKKMVEAFGGEMSVCEMTK